MAPSAIEAEKASLKMTKGNKELKSSNSPLPEVKEFDASTTTVEELVDALKIAGGVIIRNLLTKAEVDQIEADVRPWLAKDKPWEGIEKSIRIVVEFANSQATFSHQKQGVPSA
jgi:hypothetical protein